jgi:hypothetical protein
MGSAILTVENSLDVVQTWFNSEQIRADLSEPEPL